MSDVITAGRSLASNVWEQIRLRAIFEHCKWDPQSEDQSVLATYPFFLIKTALEELRLHAESLSQEALEAERELLHKPWLWERLGIPGQIIRVLRRSQELERSPTVRVMRFDFHWTDVGWRISEVNADVPGGYVESGGWNALFAEQIGGTTLLPNPAVQLARAIRETVESEGVVALVHATNFSDDRQVMMNIAMELRAAGMYPVLAGPANVEFCDGIAVLKIGSGRRRAAAILRFFPAEWLPQVQSKSDWRDWFRPSKSVVCNPGHALLLQSKRFPLVWPELEAPLTTWKRLLPETRRVGEVSLDAGDWVIKPALGRVGEDVAMKNIVSEAEFRRLAGQADRRPDQWVAQTRFRTQPVRTDGASVYPCLGVFTVNGKFAGVYGRASRTPLVNQDAQDVAVLVSDRVS
ncbi:MAG TPA: glutathionylspermidine synthase family protein [Candidatus Acidoferrum sp.]|nr:glutathionylspermidine synthase family protein [Candidatus Acidoferrum sp.]